MAREEVIPILRVKSAATAAAWYGRLGFTEEWVHRFGPTFPAFISIVRGNARIFLSEHAGDARPDTLVFLRLNDIDAIAQEFGVAVVQQPWGPELKLSDLDGNRLRIGTPSE